MVIYFKCIEGQDNEENDTENLKKNIFTIQFAIMFYQ